MKWKAIRIFISSTFRDMHTERDHLVRFVFPELKEKCRKHRVHLIDVDLRWGVTEADAQGGKALDICLDEIDTCRPYFLGLLGHLYGSIPPGEIDSITAQEIFHGVLHNDIPKQVVDLRPIIEGKLEGKTLTNEQIDCLVRCYRWNADKGKYLLREDTKDDELEIVRTVFEQYSAYQRNRSFFFFRSESFSRKLAGKNFDDFLDKEKLNRDKLANLKQEIKNEGLWWFEYDEIEAFSQKVGQILWERIESEIGELAEEDKDWMDEEAEFHELFVADRTLRFVGRRKLLDRLHEFCEKDGEPSIILIPGEPGCGKSALMGKFTTEVLYNHPDWLILPHFIGASPDSTSLRQTLKRLCTYLHRQLNIDNEVPEDTKELKQVFPDWLAKAAEHRRILIILDAVNQFEKADNAHNMQWLPQKLPDNVRFVVSTLTGEAHDALMVRRDKPEIAHVDGLDNKEIKTLVHDYLKEIRKDFPNEDDEKAFYDKIKLGNPLYILVALEELRVFGEFYKLANRIKRLPDNVPELFDQVLDRIEGDFSKPLVRDCMVLIACGRQGMTAEELQELLCAHAPQQDTIASADRLPDMIWVRLYRAFRPYLFQRSGVIDFFHSQLKDAVYKRYLKDEKDRKIIHTKIAGLFEKRWREPYHRALDELPHQLITAEDWKGIERILCDFNFIETKCEAGLVYNLVQDYSLAMWAWPGTDRERRTEEEQKIKMRRYAEELAVYANDPDQNTLPDVPNSFDIENSLIVSESSSDWNSLEHIEGWANFLYKHAGSLNASYVPTFQLAFNSTRNGPVASDMDSWISSGAASGRIWLQLLNRPDYKKNSLCIRTIPSPAGDVSMSADGSLCVSADGQALCFWDLNTTECLHRIREHTDEILYVYITPDGSKVVSYSSDDVLIVWDFKSGACLARFKGNSPARPSLTDVKIFIPQGLSPLDSAKFLADSVRPRCAVAATPDARWIITTSMDSGVRLWDSRTEQYSRIFQDNNSRISAMSLTPNAFWALTGNEDGMVCLWDIESGEPLMTLPGHTDEISDVLIGLNGRWGVSGSRDQTIRIWDLSKGECLHTFEQKSEVKHIDVTPDGRYIISSGFWIDGMYGGRDDALHLWNAESGQEVKRLSVGRCKGLSLAPDAKYVLTGGTHLQLLNLQAANSEKTDETLPLVSSRIAMGRDGALLATGHMDGTIRFWNIAEAHCTKVIAAGPEPIPITSVAVSPESKLVVSADLDGGIDLWSAVTGECLDQLMPGASVCSMSFAPEGRRLLAGDLKGGITLLDISTGEILFSIEAHNSHELKIVITPDGDSAISVAGYSGKERSDKILRVWDLKSGRCIRTLDPEDFWTESLCVTPDGRCLISSHRDEIRIWSIADGKLLRKLHSPRIDPCISISPDGNIMVANDSLLDFKTGDALIRYIMQQQPAISESMFAGMTALVFSGPSGMEFVSLENIPLREIPRVTPVRLWVTGESSSSACWDESLSASCPWCGLRFIPDKSILETIFTINRDNNIGPGDAPCLKLPGKAWDDSGLLSECPHCKKLLKFNPFIVDNKNRKKRALFSTPHHTANHSLAAERNIQYQKELKQWKSLPWLKRRKVKKPEPPRGI